MAPRNLPLANYRRMPAAPALSTPLNAHLPPGRSQQHLLAGADHGAEGSGCQAGAGPAGPLQAAESRQRGRRRCARQAGADVCSAAPKPFDAQTAEPAQQAGLSWLQQQQGLSAVHASCDSRPACNKPSPTHQRQGRAAGQQAKEALGVDRAVLGLSAGRGASPHHDSGSVQTTCVGSAS